MSDKTPTELLDELLQAEANYRDALVIDEGGISEELCDAGLKATELEKQLRTRLTALEAEAKANKRAAVAMQIESYLSVKAFTDGSLSFTCYYNTTAVEEFAYQDDSESSCSDMGGAHEANICVLDKCEKCGSNSTAQSYTAYRSTRHEAVLSAARELYAKTHDPELGSMLEEIEE